MKCFGLDTGFSQIAQRTANKGAAILLGVAERVVKTQGVGSCDFAASVGLHRCSGFGSNCIALTKLIARDGVVVLRSDKYGPANRMGVGALVPETGDRQGGNNLTLHD